MKLFLSGLLFFIASNLTAQVSSFPYFENFQSGNGGYTTGGVNSDWAWGVPLKRVINNSSTQDKCWVTGGLTTGSYANGESSFLYFPAFNFTGLSHPQLSFRVFWEMERNYDGARLQYSMDGGVVWLTLGGVNNPDTCTAANWYNNANITYLGGGPGWSGNVQNTAGSCLGGNGSGTWKTAKYDISFLAGLPNVKFRFHFGAGTTCNAFDGFAVDDIRIQEQGIPVNGFTYTCTGNQSVSFATGTACGAQYAWNFGDPASTANLSTAQDPAHVFSAAGTYTVSLTITQPSGQTNTFSQNITVLGVTINEVNPVPCRGSAGTLNAVAMGGNTYQYLWSNGGTTPSINAAAGQWSVTVQNPGACAATASYTLQEPPAITLAFITQAAKCGLANGTIMAAAGGGTAPFTYTWGMPGNRNHDTLNNIAAGVYSVTATDANGCQITAQTQLADSSGDRPFLGNDTTICSLNNFILDPGQFTTYQWNTGSTAPTLNVPTGGEYTVTVTNALGCTYGDSITVRTDCSDIYFPNAIIAGGYQNNSFGALGNIALLKNYQLIIYNRYGQKIFATNDPAKRWAGRFKGTDQNTQTFVWMAAYEWNGTKQFRKGTFILIR